METADLRQRPSAKSDHPNHVARDGSILQHVTSHPSGKAKHGRTMALIRAASCCIFFAVGCLVIHMTQLLGAPFYWLPNREFYYAYMANTKKSFGLLAVTITHWWAPTLIRISGDASVAGQFSKTLDGRIECAFPERMVMIANHQLYTDWLYLWWVGYTNSPHMHGHIYIILKESLKYIPIIGPGCMFFSFIFMSRKMSVDRPRMQHRLGKLKTKHINPNDGQSYFDPMWLLLFPEGTNFSHNGRVKSSQWAEKMGYNDVEHVMLPRSTGTFFCLNELKGTIEYVYDCTVAYEGIPRGSYGDTIFTLGSTFFQGRPPKSVNLYWRRFALADLPLNNADNFDAWLRERWYEKDVLLERYMSTGRFPANGAGIKGHVETEVRARHWWEFGQIYVMLAGFGLIFRIIVAVLRALTGRSGAS